MQPYPTQLDPEAGPMALALLEGKLPEPHKAVHVVYDAVGYGLGQLYSDAPQAVQARKMMAATAAAINWQQVLATIVQILPLILSLFAQPAPTPVVPAK